MTLHTPYGNRRTLLKASAGLGAAALLGTAPRRARAAGPETINIAYFVGTSPTMLAKGGGWIEDLTKAKVNWIEVGSGAEINTAVAAGSVDIGLGIGSSPTAAGLAQGIGYQVIAMLDNIGPAEEMSVRTAANIKTPADFRGKKIGTPFGSTSHFRLMGFLKVNGLTQRDVTVLDLRPDALVAAWQRGDIDAAYVWSPAKSKVLAAGGEVFRTFDKLEAAGYVIADVLVARTAFTEKYPDAVVSILKANNRSLDEWASEPDKSAEIIGKQAGVSTAVAKADLLEYDFVSPKAQLEPKWLGPPGKPGSFAESLQGTAKFLAEQKSIRSVPPLEVFQKGINTAPLAQALA
jgi:taurine transport system substrate-binding protein